MPIVLPALVGLNRLHIASRELAKYINHHAQFNLNPLVRDSRLCVHEEANILHGSNTGVSAEYHVSCWF
jgi:hypothetical protein